MCQALEIAFIQSHHQTQLVVVDPATKKKGQFSTTLLISINIINSEVPFLRGVNCLELEKKS